MNHQNRFTPEDFADDAAQGPLFQGARYDPQQAEFFVSHHRAFHPTEKRWLNTEPMAYVEGLNFHAAMADNPINAVNPSGT